MKGVEERINRSRLRHQQLQANIAHYEARVAEQNHRLGAFQPLKTKNLDQGSNELYDEGINRMNGPDNLQSVTAADLQREEEEIKELERKKKALEDRVSDMERDLGGLMR
jgi:peptidoglycan hydrolase CwlO-like protein